MFIDGILVDTQTVGGASIENSTDPLNIGIEHNNDGNFYPFQGWIDNLRMTVGVARYTANFTPPAAEFPTS